MPLVSDIIQAYRDLGQAQAQGSLAQGKIWGGALQSIGEMAGNYPEEARKAQVLKFQTDEIKRQQAGRQALSAAIKQFTTADPQTGKPQTDHEAVANAVAQAGFPDQANAWLKVASENSEALDKLAASTYGHAKQVRETIGDLAYSAKDPESFAAGLGLLASTPGGGLDEQTAHQIADQVTQGGSDALEAVRAKYLPFSPRYQAEQTKKQEILKAGPDETVTTRERVESGQPPLLTGGPKRTTNEWEAWQSATAKANGVANFADLPADVQQKAIEDFKTKATGEPSLQSENVLLDGKPAMVTFNPKTGKRFDGQGNDVTERVKPMPPAALQVQNAPMPEVTLNAREKAIAADLAYGGMTFSQFRSLYPSRSGAGTPVKEAIYGLAKDLNPAFEPAQFELGYRLAGNPQIRQRLVAIDSLSPVIDQAEALADQVGNSDVPAFNRLLQGAKFQIGNKAVTNFRQMQTLLGDEVGNALGVGTGSDLKTRLGLDIVNPNLSPANFRSTMEQLRTVLGQRKQALLGTMGPYGQAPPSTTPQQAPAAPAGWKYVPKPGGGWTAVPDR